MNGNGVSGKRWIVIGTLMAVLGFGATGASANFVMFQVPPHVPGVGNPLGALGAGPAIQVDRGAVRLIRGQAPIEVACSTATETGCAGELRLYSRSGAVIGSEEFELLEDEPQVLYVDLPAQPRARIDRGRGVQVSALVSAEDSLGRVGSAASRLNLRG